MSWYRPRFLLGAEADLTPVVGKTAYRRGASGENNYVTLTEGNGIFDNLVHALNGYGRPAAQTLAGQLDGAARAGAEPANGINWVCEIVDDDYVRLWNSSSSFSISGASWLGIADGSSVATVRNGVNGHAVVGTSRWSRNILEDEQLTITEDRVDPTPDLVYSAPYTPTRAGVLRQLRKRGTVGGPDDTASATCIEALDQAEYLSSSPSWYIDATGHTEITWADDDGLGEIVWPRDDDDTDWHANNPARSTWLRDILGFKGDETSTVVTTDRGDMRVLRSSKPARHSLRTSRVLRDLGYGITQETEGGRLVGGQHVARLHSSYRTHTITFDLDSYGQRVAYRDDTDAFLALVDEALPPGAPFDLFMDFPGDMRRIRSPNDVAVDRPAHDASYTSHRHPLRGRLRLTRVGSSRLVLDPQGAARRFATVTLQVERR